MQAAMKRFIRDETGLETVEYGVMLALIVIGVLFSIRTLIGLVSQMYTVTASAIATAP